MAHEEQEDTRELTAQEKHERARAFALSGSLSKFQKAKKQRKALEATYESNSKVLPVKAKPTASKKATTTTTTTVYPNQQPQRAAPPATSMDPPAHSMDPHDPSNWPLVKHGDWQYVYIAGEGQFRGRYGYYDDHGEDSLVYFGAPVLGDGPYQIPLRDLRVPPPNYGAFVAL